MKRHVVLFVFPLAFAFACKESPPEPVMEPEPPVVDEPVVDEEVPASHPSCVGPVVEGAPETVKLGAAEWVISGSTATLKTEPKNGVLTIGAVSDIKEDTEENLANLTALVKWFKKEGVDLITVAGDTGETQSQIENALEVLAGAGVPVFNIIGNREGKTDFSKAMAALRSKHIYSLNAIRRIDTAVADIVSMPGYFNPSFIHNDDGCQYFAADVAATGSIVGQCDSPVVLVSHGGPQQQGGEALDHVVEGRNVGDPQLAELIAAHSIPFGIFGNIHESGGRATDLSGKDVLEEKDFHTELYLNPGPADGVRWVMNDGTVSVGMGAVVKIKGAEAAYRVKRLGTAKP